MKTPRIIISGGGTGGHIFPAIAIANAIRAKQPDAVILFVGALGKMEMDKVPEAGYDIVGLPVAGLQRRLTLKNLSFPLKLMKSLHQAKRIIKDFKPDVVVGVGGYASGPIMRIAAKKGIPGLLQEQNSYPGLTNRLLAKKASVICVAYPDMERFFPAQKLVLTGNPVRGVLSQRADRNEAAGFWGLDVEKPTLLVLGGSLGAKSINSGVLAGLSSLPDNVQVIWQTGRYYFEAMKKALPQEYVARVKVVDFIAKMDMAYVMADMVVSRAGASSISELALLGKACAFVPSPNVSEDHQTKNAMALVHKAAALIIKDEEVDSIIPRVSELISNTEALNGLSRQIAEFAKPYAARDIADHVLKLVKA